MSSEAEIVEQKTLQQIARLSKVLARADTLELLLAELLDVAVHLANAGAGRIYTLDQTHSNLEITVSHNPHVTHEPEPPLLSLQEAHHDAVVPVYCATFGHVVNIANMHAGHGYNTSYLDDYQFQTQYRITSLLALPLINPDGQTIGVLELLNGQLAESVNQAGNRPGFCRQNEKTIASLCDIAMAVTNTVLSRELLDDQNRRLKREIALAKVELIAGDNPVMQQAINLAEMVAPQKLSVLITGETGVGKDVLARYIHRLSERRDKSFVVQNCAAVPGPLLEGELFGYKKGAFTGAVRDHAGLFVAANGGTVFLDEIGDMPIDLQAKLLRVLQEGVVKPLGSDTEISINVRVLAATHQFLDEKIANKEFRADLYHRLNGMPIHLPPLRERKNDIRLLVRHFAAQIQQSSNLQPVASIDRAAWQAMFAYDFPGNVRELRTVVERVMLMAEGQTATEAIVLQAISPSQIAVKLAPNESDPLVGELSNRIEKLKRYGLKATLEQAEFEMLGQALDYTQGRVSEAAKLLKIPERTLRHHRKRLGL